MIQAAKRYDIVALTSNDLVTDQRMQRCLTTLANAGYSCLLLGRQQASSAELDMSLPFDQERHSLSASTGKRFYWQLNRAHYKRLLSLKPRCILVVDVDTMLSGARAAAALGVPWIYDAHEYFTQLPELVRRPLVQKVWSFIANKFIPRAAACYSVGQDIAAEQAKAYGVPFSVVRNLPRKYQGIVPRVKADDFTVIYQGALNTGRGLEQLIGAATVLPEVKFWIAGTGYLEDELKQLASGSNNVEFLGELRPDDLRILTPQAHLGYALMENQGLNYYLSLSNKSLDYVHARLPSLQMDWPEYRRIQKQFGCYHLVGELSTEAVVDAIQHCRKPTNYEFLEVGCRAAANELCWENEKARLLEIFQLTLKPQSHQ